METNYVSGDSEQLSNHVMLGAGDQLLSRRCTHLQRAIVTAHGRSGYLAEIVIEHCSEKCLFRNMIASSAVDVRPMENVSYHSS